MNEPKYTNLESLEEIDMLNEGDKVMINIAGSKGAIWSIFSNELPKTALAKRKEGKKTKILYFHKDRAGIDKKGGILLKPLTDEEMRKSFGYTSSDSRLRKPYQVRRLAS